jgi:hypothetical protein
MLPRLCFLLWLTLPTFATAQHCGYDFKALIIIKLEKEPTSRVHIQLLDSLRNEVTNYNGATKKYDIPFIAWKNGKSKDEPFFPFAGNEYVLVVNNAPFRRGETFYLRIKGYQKETLVLPVQREHLYPLCGRYRLKEYPKETVYGYVPQEFWVR